LSAVKRFAAILLIGILLFNWCGYRLLSSYMESRSDRQLEAQFDDNQYDESQLISIKVPATQLSYYNPSTQFERVDGQIEVGGVLYKYVKRRLFNDSLALLCIPNHAAMSLQTAKNEFFQLVNDLWHNGQGKKTDSHPGSSKSPVAPEYLTTDAIFAMGNLYSKSFLPGTSHYTAVLPSAESLTAEQPPDQSSFTV
jgi:hypothetical protein